MKDRVVDDAGLHGHAYVRAKEIGAGKFKDSGNNHSFAQCELAYDMVYGAEPTPFMRLAAAAGAKATADGLGMLVGQAAVSYQWWRGFQPDTQTVLAAMRASLCSNH